MIVSFEEEYLRELYEIGKTPTKSVGFNRMWLKGTKSA
jgi:hypothetical protein